MIILCKYVNPYLVELKSFVEVKYLKKLGMVGRHNILFCQNILYRNCVFQNIFPIFQQIWQHFAQNSQ